MSVMRRQKPPATHEQAARFGAKANLLLGIGQLAFGIGTGNYGFMTESGHQAADAASLQAKANAMKESCHPVRARRLRKAAASVLLFGGLMGIGGGLKHMYDDTSEHSSWIEITGAVVGAAVNTAIARKSHGATHNDNHDHGHSSHSIGAEIDTVVHVMTDMGTGWLYAGALALEHQVPGIANAALIINGAAIGSAGIHTMMRIQRDEKQ